MTSDIEKFPAMPDVKPPRQIELLPGPRISRIQIARLHNLGNFEHMRVECTVELPAGTSPTSVVRELTELLDDVGEKQTITHFDLAQARIRLDKPLNPADSYDESDRLAAQNKLVRHAAWQDRREKALARFDKLGGVKVFTDAKDNWEDRDDEP